MKGCAICCYIWGEKMPIMVDVMVLGYSLQEHGNKADRMLCISDDTLQNKVAHLMKAFWTFVPVHHVELPGHLRGSEQKRLQGVYSKLQTVKLFSYGPFKQPRVLLCDADMLVRANIDDLFGYRVPAAVMRGMSDTCLYNRRPNHTFFTNESDYKRLGITTTMKGGINGGLVLFEPNAYVYEDMMEKLAAFHPETAMAEQEFLSWYWGRDGACNALHKKTTSRYISSTFQLQRTPWAKAGWQRFLTWWRIPQRSVSTISVRIKSQVTC